MQGNLDSDTLKRIESPCGCAAVWSTGKREEDTNAYKGISMFFCVDHTTYDNAVVYDSKTDFAFHPAFGWDYNGTSS